MDKLNQLCKKEKCLSLLLESSQVVFFVLIVFSIYTILFPLLSDNYF